MTKYIRVPVTNDYTITDLTEHVVASDVSRNTFKRGMKSSFSFFLFHQRSSILPEELVLLVISCYSKLYYLHLGTALTIFNVKVSLITYFLLFIDTIFSTAEDQGISKIEITYNERCTLQNQVSKLEEQHYVIYTVLYSLFEWILMIKDIFSK